MGHSATDCARKGNVMPRFRRTKSSKERGITIKWCSFVSLSLASCILVASIYPVIGGLLPKPRPRSARSWKAGESLSSDGISPELSLSSQENQDDQDQFESSETAIALSRQKRQDISISQIPVLGAPLAGVVGDLSFGGVGLSNPNDIFLAFGSPFNLCKLSPEWALLSGLFWNETYGENQDFTIGITLPPYGYIIVMAFKWMYSSLFCDFYDFLPIPVSSRPYFHIPEEGSYWSYEKK